tara:strand:+ start:5051 stop:6166 length:1116 start_codon:yes stop_codon:yes gene_type:complete
MDDYTVASLSESKNEWCARLVSTFTPAIVQGLQSIFSEAVTLCDNDDESDKYLMTFQTFLKRIPNWNPEITAVETKRIEEESGCNYLADLITCVHIVQLKALSCIRVARSSKKVNIDIPSVSNFVHKVYAKCAGKFYKNVYLYELNQEPLQIQKNNREIELLVKEGIMEAVRDTMPVEDILKAYMAEQEETINEDKAVDAPAVHSLPTASVLSSVADKPASSVSLAPKAVPQANFTLNKGPLTAGVGKLNIDPGQPLNRLEIPSISMHNSVGTPGSDVKVASTIDKPTISFNNIDYSLDSEGKRGQEIAPKTVERLESISEERNKQRKIEEEAEDDEMTLRIGEEVKLELDQLGNTSHKLAGPKLEIETLC